MRRGVGARRCEGLRRQRSIILTTYCSGEVRSKYGMCLTRHYMTFTRPVVWYHANTTLPAHCQCGITRGQEDRARGIVAISGLAFSLRPTETTLTYIQCTIVCAMSMSGFTQQSKKGRSHLLVGCSPLNKPLTLSPASLCHPLLDQGFTSSLPLLAKRQKKVLIDPWPMLPGSTFTGKHANTCHQDLQAGRLDEKGPP